MLLYATVMFKPLLPIVTDAWSHTFAETAHIINVHLKYGNDHLQKELADTSSDNASSKDQNTIKTEDLGQVHLMVSEYSIDFISLFKTKNYPLLLFHKIPLVFILKHMPPPKIQAA